MCTIVQECGERRGRWDHLVENLGEEIIVLNEKESNENR